MHHEMVKETHAAMHIDDTSRLRIAMVLIRAKDQLYTFESVAKMTSDLDRIYAIDSHFKNPPNK